MTNTRPVARIGLAVLVVVLLFQSGSLWAQKAKAIELAAVFRDATDDKIRSDGGGAYRTVRNPDRTYDSIVQLSSANGTLNMQVLRQRTVRLILDDSVRPAPLTNGQLTCHEWTGGVFYADPPSFFPPGEPNNDSFYVTTFGEITYNGSAWVYDPDPPFDLRAMKVDPVASTLIRVQINFYTAEDPGLYGVMPNYQLWSAETSLAGGVVKVTHPRVDEWIVEPQDPEDAVPLRSLGLNEAGFKVAVPEVKRVRSGGNCDLGDWVMPFKLTLYRQ